MKKYLFLLIMAAFGCSSKNEDCVHTFKKGTYVVDEVLEADGYYFITFEQDNLEVGSVRVAMIVNNPQQFTKGMLFKVQQDSCVERVAELEIQAVIE